MTEHMPGMDFNRDPQTVTDIREQTKYIVVEALEGTRESGQRSAVELIQSQSTVVEGTNVYSVKLSRSGGGAEIGNELLMVYVPPKNPEASLEEMAFSIYDVTDNEPYDLGGPLRYVHLRPDGTQVSTQLTDELTLWVPRVYPFEHGKDTLLDSKDDIVRGFEDLLAGELSTRPKQINPIDLGAYALDLLSVLSNDMELRIVSQNS